MKIPPGYRIQEWRRLFVGMALGALISWLIFLYIYGEWQEKYSKTIKEQEESIHNLKKEKEIWQEDIQKLNKENKDKLTIQKIEVKIINYERYKLDLFSVYEIEEDVKEDIRSLLAKDIETAYKSRELLRRTIENKTFKAHDKRYRLQIEEIIYYTTLSVHLTIQFDD